MEPTVSFAAPSSEPLLSSTFPVRLQTPYLGLL